VRVPSQTPVPASPAIAQTTGLDCWDVGGIARSIKQANPQIDWTSQLGAGALFKATMYMQVLMGCRAP
jgi:hypothetical protein